MESSPRRGRQTPTPLSPVITGSVRVFTIDPGAYAPGFMLAPASQATTTLPQRYTNAGANEHGWADGQHGRAANLVTAARQVLKCHEQPEPVGHRARNFS